MPAIQALWKRHSLSHMLCSRSHTVFTSQAQTLLAVQRLGYVGHGRAVTDTEPAADNLAATHRPQSTTVMHTSELLLRI